VARNVLAKVRSSAQSELKGDYWAIFEGIERDGETALAEGRRRAKRFVAKRKPPYPSAVACAEDNLESLLAYLAFPAEHHKRIRHSDLIGRTFGETRRRVKGDRAPPRRAEVFEPRLGRARPRLEGGAGSACRPRPSAGYRTCVVSCSIPCQVPVRRR
jgi:transposase-like protein